MKKVISILVSLVMLLGAFAVTASAADEITAAGFYNIGTNENMTITAASSAGDSVEAVTVDVDGDGNDDTLYANSDVLNVEYSAAVEDAYYGVILVEGTELPTVDSDIYYIDQVTAGSATISLDVFPKLPEAKTDLTLYLSTNAAGKGLESVVLSYTPEDTFGAGSGSLEYTLGDVNGDNAWDSADALSTLQIGANLMPEATEAEKAAADVDENGAWDSTDALMILQYGAGLITSWK